MSPLEIVPRLTVTVVRVALVPPRLSVPPLTVSARLAGSPLAEPMTKVPAVTVVRPE